MGYKLVGRESRGFWAEINSKNEEVVHPFLWTSLLRRLTHIRGVDVRFHFSMLLDLHSVVSLADKLHLEHQAEELLNKLAVASKVTVN